MAQFALICFMLIALVFVYTRLGLASPVTTLAVSNLISCAILLWVNQTGLTKFDFILRDVYFSAMPMDGLEPYSDRTLLFFTFISFLCVIVCSDIKPFRFHSSSGSESSSSVIPSFQKWLDKSQNSGILVVGGLILLGFSVVHFAALDKSLLWYNTSYLTIKTPEQMGLDGEFTRLYHSVFRLVGLFGGILAALLIAAGRPVVAFLFFLLWVYAVGLLLLGNSRWLIVYFASVGLTFSLALRGWKGNFVLVIMLALSFAAFMQVLFGRSGGEFGIRVMLSNPLNFSFSDVPLAIRGLFINVFEGALNFANSLLTAPSFSGRYQAGSIFPLVSAIDDFDSIALTDRVQFAPHVPMGAFGEVFHFDISYQLIYLIVLVSTMRVTVIWQFSLSKLNFLPLAVFYMYVFYLLPTYSSRTTTRFLFLGFFIYAIWPFFRRMLPKKLHRAAARGTENRWP